MSVDYARHAACTTRQNECRTRVVSRKRKLAQLFDITDTLAAFASTPPPSNQTSRLDFIDQYDLSRNHYFDENSLPTPAFGSLSFPGLPRDVQTPSSQTDRLTTDPTSTKLASTRATSRELPDSPITNGNAHPAKLILDGDRLAAQRVGDGDEDASFKNKDGANQRESSATSQGHQDNAVKPVGQDDAQTGQDGSRSGPWNASLTPQKSNASTKTDRIPTPRASPSTRSSAPVDPSSQRSPSNSFPSTATTADGKPVDRSAASSPTKQGQAQSRINGQETHLDKDQIAAETATPGKRSGRRQPEDENVQEQQTAKDLNAATPTVDTAIATPTVDRRNGSVAFQHQKSDDATPLTAGFPHASRHRDSLRSVDHDGDVHFKNNETPKTPHPPTDVRFPHSSPRHSRVSNLHSRLLDHDVRSSPQERPRTNEKHTASLLNGEYEDLRGVAEEGRRDYLEPLFACQAHQRPNAAPLSELLNQATKTLSTANRQSEIKEQQAYRTLRRIYHLQNANKWPLRQIERAPDPGRQPNFLDHMLREMKWMRTDFREERKWKIATARHLAKACAEWVAATPQRRAALQVRTVSVVSSQEVNGLTTADASQESFVKDSDAAPWALDDAPISVTATSHLLHTHLGVPSFTQSDQERATRDKSALSLSLPVSKFVTGKILADSAVTRELPSRYEVKRPDSGTDPTLSGPWSDVTFAEETDIALFATENKHLRDRLWANHIFRPPSEFPMPSTTFFESRSSSQWIWEEDQKLKEHAQEYRFNWSLVADTLSTRSTFVSSAERRTPWECFERWVQLEGLPQEMAKMPYFKTYQSRLENAQRAVTAQQQAQQQQLQAQGQNAASANFRRRNIQPVRVEKRRNTKHLALLEAMRKLARRREQQSIKQQESQWPRTYPWNLLLKHPPKRRTPKNTSPNTHAPYTHAPLIRADERHVLTPLDNRVAALRKSNEAPQPKPNLHTPQEFAKLKHEREQRAADRAEAYRQQMLAQQRAAAAQRNAAPQQSQQALANGLSAQQRSQLQATANGPAAGLVPPGSNQAAATALMAQQQRQTPMAQAAMLNGLANSNMTPAQMAAAQAAMPQAQMQAQMQNQRLPSHPSPENMRLLVEANRAAQQQRNFVAAANAHPAFQRQMQNLAQPGGLASAHMAPANSGLHNAQMLAALQSASQLNSQVNVMMAQQQQQQAAQQQQQAHSNSAAGSPNMLAVNSNSNQPQPLSSGHIPAINQIQHQIAAQQPNLSPEQARQQTTDRLKHMYQLQRQNALNAAAGNLAAFGAAGGHFPQGAGAGAAGGAGGPGNSVSPPPHPGMSMSPSPATQQQYQQQMHQRFLAQQQQQQRAAAAAAVAQQQAQQQQVQQAQAQAQQQQGGNNNPTSAGGASTSHSSPSLSVPRPVSRGATSTPIQVQRPGSAASLGPNPGSAGSGSANGGTGGES